MAIVADTSDCEITDIGIPQRGPGERPRSLLDPAADNVVSIAATASPLPLIRRNRDARRTQIGQDRDAPTDDHPIRE
jgi:hypothetical protein